MNNSPLVSEKLTYIERMLFTEVNLKNEGALSTLLPAKLFKYKQAGEEFAMLFLSIPRADMNDQQLTIIEHIQAWMKQAPSFNAGYKFAFDSIFENSGICLS